jgi:hypothetical protein
MGWIGMVEAPDGRAGIPLGTVGAAAAELDIEKKWNVDEYGSARIDERGFDNQWFLADLNGSSSQPGSMDQNTGSDGVGFVLAGPFADQLGVHGKLSSAPDGHAVQSDGDSPLLGGQHSILNKKAIVDVHGTLHSGIVDSRALIDDGSSLSYRTVMSAMILRPEAAIGPLPTLMSSILNSSRFSSSLASRSSGVSSMGL